MSYSVHFVCDDADARNVRARREQNPLHCLGLQVKVPTLVRTGDESPLRVPSGDIGVFVVEEEEQKLLGLASVNADSMPLASVLHLVLEDVSVEDAAVDYRNRDFLIVLAAVPADEMPSLAWDVLVDAGDWGSPMFLPMDGTLNALSTLEPVRGAKDSPQTEK